MIKLNLVREYLAGPIFCPDIDRMGHVDIDDLPISQKLRVRVGKWDSVYQATFNSDYPPESGFSTAEAELQHVAEGQQLAIMMQQELESGYIVEYCP
ncbi:hypothetical protein [Pseudomonas sp. GV071]|uniref:hypothetical protein n=1 Tax=Pseudomonas sp. GV071 TaxID=2135754 RepID=UPI000D38A995|nr:hypothetical protein [Pseudomonas sp. GV071]